MKGASRVRLLAGRYFAATGEHVYSGKDSTGTHYFSDGYIKGDQAAYEHMLRMCQEKGVEV